MKNKNEKTFLYTGGYITTNKDLIAAKWRAMDVFYGISKNYGQIIPFLLNRVEKT